MKNLLIVLMASFLMACQNSSATMLDNSDEKKNPEKILDPIVPNSIAYFASGCFWCVEAVFESVKGVGEVESGYSGGKIVSPSYELICTGKTRHAEAVKVYYDSNLVSYSVRRYIYRARCSWGGRTAGTLRWRSRCRTCSCIMWAGACLISGARSCWHLDHMAIQERAHHL